MGRASGANAASTARRAGRGVRTFLALSAICVLSLTSSVILASPPAASPQAVGGAQTAAPVAIATGAVSGSGTGSDTEGPRRDVPDAPVATDVPPGHGGPPPRCDGTDAGASVAKVVHHGSRADKVVALTFDDGWDAANVAKILAILQKAKVNATFFPTGQAVRKSPAAWKAVAFAGFPIANHTYDHKDLTTMCEAGQLAELARQDAVLAKDLGLTAQPYMRPPGGNWDIGTRLAAAEDGEQAVMLWDVDTRDWTGLSTRGIIALAISGTNGSIVIMHTMMPNTVSALPTIIAKYRARGFTFVTIGQLLGIAGPVPFP